jgi:hypothetical protein
MLEMMAAQFAGSFGSSLGAGMGGGGGPGGGAPLLSGGGALDARSFMDGSGWTVATGGSRARGGTVGAKSQDGTLEPPPPGYGADVPPMRAGVSPWVAGLMLAMVAGGWLWSRRNR